MRKGFQRPIAPKKLASGIEDLLDTQSIKPLKSLAKEYGIPFKDLAGYSNSTRGKNARLGQTQISPLIAYVDKDLSGGYDPNSDQLLVQVTDNDGSGGISNGDTYYYAGTYDSSGNFTELNIEDIVTNYTSSKLKQTDTWYNTTGTQQITLCQLLGNSLNSWSSGDSAVPDFYQNLVTPLSSLETAITYGVSSNGSMPYPILFA